MRSLTHVGHWTRVAFAVVLTGTLLPLGMIPGAAVGVGPCDTPANPVVAENCLPGAPKATWDVAGSGDASIQGYATRFSVDQGETVEFKVKTDASSYRIDVYRLGWYGGDGARLVGTVTPSATLPQIQPACLTEPTTGLVDCGNWAASASWAVPSGAASGVYIGKLVRTDATPGASHIYFVVRDDARSSDALFQTSDTTWQAYNRYGGNSLYSGSPAGRAYKVSYNRPFDTRAVAPESFLFNAEYPMLRWMERNGYDVTYASGADTDRDAAGLLQHEAFLSVGQDEYWSGNQRANVEAARDAGVNLAFFSGNESFWKTRWEPSIDGSATARRTLVSYKETHANAKIDPTVAWTGTWRDARFSPPADGGRPENALTGTIFTVNSGTAAVQVPAAEGQLRLWRNTSIPGLGTTATLAAGTLGYEWDEDLDNGSRPPGQIDLSSTTVSVPEKLQDLGSTYAPGVATHSVTLHRRGDALVFGAGTVQWSWGLDETHDRDASTPSVDMQQATVNLLADMDTQPATLQAELVAATASSDTAAPSATITAPAAGTSVPTGTAVTVSGTATDGGGGLVGGTEVSTDGGSTWHRATGRGSWSYTFTPTALGPLTLRARATDDSANLGASSPSVGITVTTAACPCSLWNETAVPAVPAISDFVPIELGVKFSSDVDGVVTGLRFYKGAANTGTHVGHLWSSTGTLLATATFTGESASGWQQVAFSPPVTVTAGTTYVASYYSPSGYFAYDVGYFAAHGLDTPPLHAPTNAGVFNYLASGFPTSTGGANYWVDVVFETGSGTDTTPPTVTARNPGPGATGVAPTGAVTAGFSEALDPATISTATVGITGPGASAVPATIAYDNGPRRITITPNDALAPLTTYSVTIQGGSGGVADAAGNTLAADVTWTFTTAPPPPDSGPGGPILVVGDTGNPFGRYTGEILAAEGLAEYRVKDITGVTAAVLADYQVVILGEMDLTAAQVSMLTTWVGGGGNLVALRPDPQLAGLLGLTSAGSSISDRYLRVDTSTAPGAGITGQTIQFHGPADRYTTSGATTVANLYTDATTATANPAVSLRSVGSNGGQAAAFTYDLARSIVTTRQGNPAWSGQERDGITPIRPDDLFFGNAASDPQPDWVDLAKAQIPQADEQSRLLANLVTTMNADKIPLPRLWYLPHGKKAAVVMSGDDHANGGTAGRFDAELAASAPGCSVADWECVRSTSYVYANAPLTDAQAQAYVAAGFEVAAHVNTGCADWTPASLDADFTSQFAAWTARYPSAPAPKTNRTHCIVWSDYSTQPHVERAHGVRLDASYYFWPPSWVADRPGLFTGSATPMRFADADGSAIDVYQVETQMTDESGQSYPQTINTLLDNAIGPNGYFGVYTANMHTDTAESAGHDAIVAAAQARDVPVISARQLLEWVDGRNSSSFDALAFSGNVLTFTMDAAAGAQGLQAMVPTETKSGAPLSAITHEGTPVPFTARTVKGVSYAFFDAVDGDYTATYVADTAPPVVSAVAALATPAGTATVTWTTNEPATSRVDYGTDPALLTSNATAPGLVTTHTVTLSGLTPGRTYSFRVTSLDAGDNATTTPTPPATPAGFVVPTFAATDTTATDFAAGTAGACAVTTHTGDGEIGLSPAVGAEFGGTTVPPAFEQVPWTSGGSGTVAGGLLTVNGARVNTTAMYTPGRTLEFVATFTAGPFQHVGFANDLNDAPWAIFSTGSDGTALRARTNGGTEQSTVIPGNWLGSPHRYRITWNASSVTYSVDGNQVASHATAIGSSMRPIASDPSPAAPSLTVDWLQLSPFATSCQFASRTFDAGLSSQWLTLQRTATTPVGASATFETRTSSDATTWSAWSATSGTAITSPTARYLQYRSNLATTDPASSPSVEAVTLTARSAPTVTMVLPADGSSARGVLYLDAVASAGTTNVEFRATGGSLTDQVIGTGVSTIYGWITGWNTPAVANGTYSVSAIATDGNGASTRSAANTVTIDNTAPATAVVTAPANNASIRATVPLTATATDNVAVTKVEFRVTGGTLTDTIVATDTSATGGWTGTWNTVPVANGTYALTALAYDAAGNTKRSTANTVTIDNTAPATAVVTAPVNNASIRATVPLTATATDNVAVTKVEFRVTGGTLTDTIVATDTSATGGWTGTWNTVPVANGTYALTALAYDAAGNIKRSAAVTVTIDNTAPATAVVTAPVNNASIRATVPLTATATDNVAVTKVEFRVTGGTLTDTIVATDTSATGGWTGTWNTVPVANGTYALTALAYDAAGNIKRSAAVTVTIDNTAPATAVVTAPVNNASIRATVPLTATATDNVAVTKVEFRVTGGTLTDTIVATDTSATGGWTGTWNTVPVANGTYALTALAYDAAGNIKRSAAVTVTIDNTAPATAVVTAPLPNATVAGPTTLVATATDNVAVTKVEFRVTGGTLNDVVVATDTSAAGGWSGSVNAATIANGVYSLTALAYDAAGNTRRSSAVTVNVLH